MMPKISDVSNDWMLIARIPGDHYRYKWRCLACGDTIIKREGIPPAHPCHRRFAPQTEEDKQLVSCWYRSDFDLNETAITAGLDYKTTCKRLSACEIGPWPRVSQDVHHDVDGEVDEDG